MSEKETANRDRSRSPPADWDITHRQKPGLRIQGRGLMSRRDGGHDQKNITDFNQVDRYCFSKSASFGRVGDKLYRSGQGYLNTDLNWIV